ncbi:hypothetical protein Tco_0568713 [Tanacetum coccineum]
MLGSFLGLYILNGVQRFQNYKGKKERVKFIALKDKKESSDDETSTSESDDKEYAMFVKNFKKFFGRKGRFVRQPREEKKSYQQRDDKKSESDRKCFRCYDLNHLISEFPKPPRNKDQKAFVGGCWSDSKNVVEDQTNDETCLMAQSSNEVTFDSSHYSDNASSFDDDKNAKVKETQVKFVKFDKSANSLREMLNIRKSPSCKIGLGFDKSKASTSGTKPMSFVGSTAELAGDRSTLKADGSTLPGFVDLSNSQKEAEHAFSPPLSRNRIL